MLYNVNMLKLIIFDWDDVFTLGSTNAYHACYITAAKEAGASTNPEIIKKVVNELWGRPHEFVIETYLGEEKHLLEEVNQYYSEYIQSEVFLNELSIIPGSVELLERLYKKYKLAVISGINPILLQKVFHKFSVPPVFEKITTSYDLVDRNRGKPYPDMMLQTLEYFGVVPNEAVHVGDASSDVKMALAVGVEPVVVLTGQLTKSEAVNLKVAHILNDVTKLEELLTKL